MATTSMDETQRRAPVRAESGSRPKPPGNSAVPKPQAEGPWRNAARLGSPHLEPARLTVSELPSRHVLRVNRHTPKKAVMAAYAGAGFDRAVVDKRATVARQGGRYSRQRVAENDVVSVVILRRGSSTGRALDCRSRGCRFDPGPRRQIPRSGGRMVKPRGFQPRNCGFESRPDPHGPVAQQAEHATDNREGDRSNRSRSTTLWE